MVFEKVRAIIAAQLELNEDSITIESLVEDLGADSIDLVDIVVRLEEEFDDEIPEEDIENLKSVGDIVKYIEDKMA